MPLKMFQESTPASKQPSKIKSIIAIAAGKGGVGKSSVTVNLALALHQAGFKVGILDADIYGPSIRHMLPEDQFPSQVDGTLIPAISLGIRVISMAYFRKTQEAAAVRAPIANSIITQFLKQVEWGELDYLLIDFPPGTGDIQLTLAQQADLTGALIVTTPQEVALLDVRKAMNLFYQVKIPVLGIIENMSYYYHQKTDEKIHLFGQGGGERLAKETGTPLLASIPIDPEICASGDSGHSLFEQDPAMKSPTTQSFVSLATQLTKRLELTRQHAKDCLPHFELVWKEMSNG